MLKTIKIDNLYEVRVESNNKLIGHFILSDDGYYQFAPYDIDGGLWSDYVLLEVANKLKAINKPWDDEINDYFEKERQKNSYGTDINIHL